MATSRLALDTDPAWPLPGGAYNGWLRDEAGNRIVLVKGQDNIFNCGAFCQGVWPVTLGWTNIIIELKALANNGRPLATQAALASENQTAADVTLANWQAGTAQHAAVTLASASLSAITAGTIWMIVSLGTSGSSLPVACGRVTVSSA